MNLLKKMLMPIYRLTPWYKTNQHIMKQSNEIKVLIQENKNAFEDKLKQKSMEINILIQDIIVALDDKLEKKHNELKSQIHDGTNSILNKLGVDSNTIVTQIRDNANTLDAKLVHGLSDIKSYLHDETNEISASLISIGKYNVTTTEMLHKKHDAALEHMGCNFYGNVNNHSSAIGLWYLQEVGKSLNLKKPKTLNEKLQWLKVFENTSIKTKLADKYAVRQWVADEIGEEYLIPLYGVWDNYAEIDFARMPDCFVLKYTHGSSMNYMVMDKNKLNMSDVKYKFEKWSSAIYPTDGSYIEPHYKNIIPRIIAEECLGIDEGYVTHYRFFCFNGEVKLVRGFKSFHETSKNGKSNREISFFYDANWKRTSYTLVGQENSLMFTEPSTFVEMKNIAQILSRNFTFVCVDLYELNNSQIFFSEMTFYPAKGVWRWTDEAVDLKLGKMLKLPYELQ